MIARVGVDWPPQEMAVVEGCLSTRFYGHIAGMSISESNPQTDRRSQRPISFTSQSRRPAVSVDQNLLIIFHIILIFKYECIYLSDDTVLALSPSGFSLGMSRAAHKQIKVNDATNNSDSRIYSIALI